MGDHPWRRFRALVDWTLYWAHLPDGTLGVTDYRRRTVTLAHGMDQAERRCTIAHEIEHIERGPVHGHAWPREERVVDEAVARRLITFEALVDAMRWSTNEHEAADHLWVDVPTVVVRLETLLAWESDELVRRLDEAELRHP